MQMWSACSQGKDSLSYLKHLQDLVESFCNACSCAGNGCVEIYANVNAFSYSSLISFVRALVDRLCISFTLAGVYILGCCILLVLDARRNEQCLA